MNQAIISRTMAAAIFVTASSNPMNRAAEAQNQPIVLPQVLVKEAPITATELTESYNVSNSSSATKTDTPIMETPFSIQVVPNQVLKDQQTIQAKDAIKNVSGAQQGFDFGDNTDSFILRGFDTSDNLRNGLFGAEFQADLANIDRLEVIKGPAAILYGRMEPAGALNFVTKLPLSQTQYILEQQFGSYQFFRTHLDGTGPLNQNKTVTYRFNYAYQNNQSFRDHVHKERFFVAPSLLWKPNERFELISDFQYRHENTFNDSGLPAIGDRPARLPIRRDLSDGDNRQVVDSYSGALRASLALAPNWKLRAHYQGTYDLRNEDDVASAFLDEATGIMDRNIFKVKTPFVNHNVNLDTVGKFNFAGVANTLLIGADYRYRAVTNSGKNWYTSDDPVNLPPINIYQPVYGIVNQAAFADNFFTKNYDSWYGAYVQNQLTVAERFHVLVGVRHDWASTSGGYDPTALKNVVQEKVKDRKFSPRVGLLYRPWDWFSIYANYVEGLGFGTPGTTASGSPLKPQDATSYEFGFKNEFFGGKLSANLAFYHLTKSNIPVADPANLNFLSAIGEQRSRGVELDIAGQITEQVSVIATYAFTDAEITKDTGINGAGNLTSGNTGNRPGNVAKNVGSVWLKYKFPEDFLTGLSLGGGVSIVGQRYGDPANSFKLSAYARTDVMAAYRFRIGPTWLSAQLNVNNLFDKKYSVASETLFAPRQSIMPGAPRTFLGLLKIEF